VSNLTDIKSTLLKKQYTWLLTGAAGFIGSNILEFLIEANQKVIAIDNLSTGFRKNLEIATSNLENKDNYQFIELDISDKNKLFELKSKNIDFIIHHAAVASVPVSIEKPEDSHLANIDGFFNILELARALKVKKVIYASSSAVYGDEKSLPAVENKTGNLLSPYAANKMINEIYAQTWGQCYGLDLIGLRYFNVFGKRQDPNGAYAAVIPIWCQSMINNEAVYINGDGSTTRDFCYIDDIILANISSALSDLKGSHVYNIASGIETSLNKLITCLKVNLSKQKINVDDSKIINKSFRDGDIKNSVANIEKAKNDFGYSPSLSFNEALSKCVDYYISLSNEAQK
jgi:UDP-N-acetylglucosamine 4-epimerase